VLYLCVDVVIVKFNLSDECPMANPPVHWLEVLQNTVDHEGIVFVAHSQHVSLLTQGRQVT